VFKTARFKIHNPSRHKIAVLNYVMRQYHLTLKHVLETALALPDLKTRITKAGKSGRLRLDAAALSRLLYPMAPKGWCLAPLRDYLIGSAKAMLLSHFAKELKGKNESNPPTLRSLDALTDEQRDHAFEQFTNTIEFPKNAGELANIAEQQAAGRVRKAERLEAIFSSRAAARAVRDLLRADEAPLPIPTEFTRPDVTRGFTLARKQNRVYLLIRLFSPTHRWYRKLVLEDGFIDLSTGEDLSGQKFPGLVLPLEFGRDYHELEFLTHGRPQSAKIVLRREDSGETQFYVHVAFEFEATPLQVETYIGIDRGAARIGSASIVDADGAVIQRGIVLEGTAFNAEMRTYVRSLSALQAQGKKIYRNQFRLRRRRADMIVGEYANRLIALALANRSQIILEAVDPRSMARFLTMSQFRKLHDVLAYKAERAGLPPPIEVPAAFTSQTCHVCGHTDRASRVSQKDFRCTKCGHEDNADNNASVVIALRGLHQIQKGGKFQKFASFSEWMAGGKRLEAMPVKVGR
jgi:hypothetical protein